MWNRNIKTLHRRREISFRLTLSTTQAILRVLARQDLQRDLFADPQLDYAKAVQFYQVDVDWFTDDHPQPVRPHHLPSLEPQAA